MKTIVAMILLATSTPNVDDVIQVVQAEVSGTLHQMEAWEWCLEEYDYDICRQMVEDHTIICMYENDGMDVEGCYAE